MKIFSSLILKRILELVGEDCANLSEQDATKLDFSVDT
jgi:hypothetical protein